MTSTVETKTDKTTKLFQQKQRKKIVKLYREKKRRRTVGHTKLNNNKAKNKKKTEKNRGMYNFFQIGYLFK